MDMKELNDTLIKLVCEYLMSHKKEDRTIDHSYVAIAVATLERVKLHTLTHFLGTKI
jgi:hypothetical protein